ncbi:MAG TPA: tRNA preQ1(34) S-adenosylmethionine ribosyltransferase-isomerase QueA [Polyangiaceae bacterium]|nr:tRNA preQ1(34) S-adenosylmethionine ribosyltransferase-isomerase QueA [Polyangiaceae bacterium]
MKTELLDYPLPDALIARHPPHERDGGRLLVLDGARRTHHSVRDFAELVPEGALVVLNASRVRRARVFGQRRPGGGRVELLFLEQSGRSEDGRERWAAIGRASKPLRPGVVIEAEGLEVEVAANDAGSLTLLARANEPLETLLDRIGHVPLPPYLGRGDEPEDVERYQTVYAERTGSVAAPTAGLHLTEAMLARMRARGVDVHRLELAVGIGTFRPVSAEDLDAHPMHEERFSVSAALVRAVAETKARGLPVVAVGTTVVRALESAAASGELVACEESTRLLIQPGYRFRVVDSLLTNFHQPKSTLLALVAAFAGYDAVMAAYAEAIEQKYRFLSYGDAMFIPRRAS